MPLIALSSPTPNVVSSAPISVHAGVSIRGVGGVELVSVADPRDPFVLDDAVEEHEIIVPRYTKHVADTDLRESVKDVVSDGE